MFGGLFADAFELFRALGHDDAFGEDGRGARRGDGEAPVDEMSGEFGLRVLVCVLAVEIGGAYKGAFLFPMLVFGCNSGLCQVVYTFAGGLYHASNEVAVVAGLAMSGVYR